MTIELIPGMLIGVATEKMSARLDRLRRRRSVLRMRIEELEAERLDGPREGVASTQLTAARHQLAISVAAAEQAVASSISAFHKAADTHDRTAELHEKAAAAGSGDADAHRQRAAYHRAAAAKDRERADQIAAMLSEPDPGI